MQDGFHDSTIDATRYLICFAPDRLDAWLTRHPPGEVLYRVARERILAARKASPEVLERLLASPEWLKSVGK